MHSYKSGYNIFEMSVVLLIIGLIVGGIVVASDMIRKAELNSILADSEKIQNAVYAFQKKYEYLPGDFPRAQTYWGSDTNCPPLGPTTSNLIPKVETCNGDGNGKLNAPPVHGCVAVTATSYEQEPYRLWQHLSNAGMFPGFYTGVQGSSASILYGRVGINVPKSSKVEGVGFQLMNYDNISGTFGWTGTLRFSNLLFIGRQDTGTSCAEVINPFIHAAEAQSIDQKVDDGYPGRGNLMAYSDNGGRCADSSDPTVAVYVKDITSYGCSLIQKINW